MTGFFSPSARSPFARRPFYPNDPVEILSFSHRRTPNYADNKPLFTAKAQRAQRSPFFSFAFESPAEAGCKQKQMKNIYTRRPRRLCGASVCSKVRVRQRVSSERSELVVNKELLCQLFLSRSFGAAFCKMFAYFFTADMP